MRIQEPIVKVQMIGEKKDIMCFIVSRNPLANEYVITIAEYIPYHDGKIIVNSKNPIIYDYQAHPAIRDLVEINIFKFILPPDPPINPLDYDHMDGHPLDHGDR